MLLCNQYAYAYLDGNTGSILVQLLFGGLASGIYIIKLYWEKVKAFLFKSKNTELVEKDVREDQDQNVK